MVRITNTVFGAALAISLASALPARRQVGVEEIEIGNIPIGGEDNGSLGNSVQIPTPTVSIEDGPEPTEPPEEDNEEEDNNNEHENQTVTHTTIINGGGHGGFPQYGSGSIDWHINYQSCVQQCFEVHAPPPTVVTLPPHEGQGKGNEEDNNEEEENNEEENNNEEEDNEEENNGEEDIDPNAGEAGGAEGGNGNVHEIMVEPARDALRFVPAFVNAEIGDTLRFTVVNGVHSIIQSSALLPCNATDGGFDSGVKNAGETFETVIESKDTIFFFSGEGNDCQAGLFGGVNAATGLEESETSVKSFLPKLAAENPDIAAALDATNKLASQTAGLEWANKLDISPIPESLRPQLASSVLFTRATMGYNPDMIGTDGVFRPTNDVVIPSDITALLATADKGGYGASPAEAEKTTPEQTAALNSEGPAQTQSSGAGSLVSSRVAVAGVAILAAFFML